MGYYVSRQHYYYSHEYVVEIEPGGIDYSGSDMLVAEYEPKGEGREFDDPREAVKAAIAIRDAWRSDKQLDIHISYGQTTAGMGMEHDPDKEDDDAAAMAWAEKRYGAIPKCDHCGNPLPEKWIFIVDDPDAGKFCREYCADKASEEIYLANQEDE